MFSFLHETDAGNYSLRDLLNILQTSSSNNNWFLTEYCGVSKKSP